MGIRLESSEESDRISIGRRTVGLCPEQSRGRELRPALRLDDRNEDGARPNLHAVLEVLRGDRCGLWNPSVDAGRRHARARKAHRLSDLRLPRQTTPGPTTERYRTTAARIGCGSPGRTARASAAPVTGSAFAHERRSGITRFGNGPRAANLVAERDEECRDVFAVATDLGKSWARTFRAEAVRHETDGDRVGLLLGPSYLPRCRSFSDGPHRDGATPGVVGTSKERARAKQTTQGAIRQIDECLREGRLYLRLSHSYRGAFPTNLPIADPIAQDQCAPAMRAASSPPPVTL